MMVTRKKTLVVVDGFSLAYRMYFALERTGMATKAGQPTWALYGFYNALFQLLKQEQPDAVVFCFDVAGGSFRNVRYPAYKAHRSAMPDAMRQQLDPLFKGIELMGFPVYKQAGFEADDLIGTIAQTIRTQHGDDWQIDILTGDQDAFQLIDEAGIVTVLVPSRTPREGLKRYDWEAVIEKVGVPPNQVIDFKGLKGDASDNIPGVPGVGDKTATKLLQQYPTVEAIYDDLPAIKPAGLQLKLQTNEAQAHLSKMLATIDCDVDMGFDIADCHLKKMPNPADVLAFFQEFELNQFVKNISVLEKLFHTEAMRPVGFVAEESSTFSLSSSSVGEGFKPSRSKNSTDGDFEPLSPTASTLPPFLPKTAASLEEVSAFIAKAEQMGMVAFDLETTGLDPFTAQPVGISLAIGQGLHWEDHPTENHFNLSHYPKKQPRLVSSAEKSIAVECLYIPVGHNVLGSENLPWDAVKDLIQPLVESTKTLKLIHNLKYECNVLKAWGLHLTAPVVDTMLMSYVCQPESRHGLKSLALTVLGFEMTEIQTLIGKGKSQKTFDTVPVADACPYACADTYATWLLAHTFTQRFTEEQWALLSEIELPLAWLLAEMERTGIHLNREHLAGMSHRLAGQLQLLERDIHALAGEPFNLNSPKQVADILFVKLGISTHKKTGSKTGYSTDAQVLEALSDAHPIVPKLLEYRQLFKLKSTYIDALPALVHPQTHRLHTHFNQTVTATGRLSSSDPNLQNIPVRSALGQEIRAAFVPQPATATSPAWKLVSADYSQIELRILAHIAQEPTLIAAFQSGEDIHTKTAALVLGVPIDAVTKEERYKAKAVNFGIVYGQTAHGLSQQLGISRAEAQAFIDQYFRTYPGVKTFIESTKAKAHETGVSKTMFGKVRHLAVELQSSVKSIREFAERASFNTPIQGSASDVMKLAMLRLRQALADAGLQAKLLLQVHDELILEAPESEIPVLLPLITKALELEQPLSVPLVVDTYVADAWFEQ
jgi:DNA polymerase I